MLLAKKRTKPHQIYLKETSVPSKVSGLTPLLFHEREDMTEIFIPQTSQTYHATLAHQMSLLILICLRQNETQTGVCQRSRKEEANQQKHSLAARSRTKQERAKWKSVIGTKGNEEREFSPKSVDVDGKLHH